MRGWRTHFICGLTATALARAEAALASTRVDPDSAQQDLLLIVAAVTAVVLFYLLKDPDKASRSMPMGRRRSDLVRVTSPSVFADRDTRREEREDPLDAWIPETVAPFGCSLYPAQATWQITLFGARRISGNQNFLKTADGFYEICKKPDDSDKVIAPVVRKIISKYSEHFDTAAPILVLRRRHENALVTWLPNEAFLRSAACQFLDETLVISREINVHPSLCITWDDTFVITVTWPPSLDLNALVHMCAKHPEMQLSVSRANVTLALWLAFPRDRVPEEILAEKRNLLMNPHGDKSAV